MNLVLIGGVKIDEIAKSLEGTKLDIVKKFEFVEDAFNDVVKNSGEYLDVDAMVILQYGIKSDSDPIVQIKNLQEALLLFDFKAKLYVALKDLETFNYCKDNLETVIIYSKTRINYFSRISNKTIVDLCEGMYDVSSLYMNTTDTGLDLNIEDDLTISEKRFTNEPPQEIEVSEEPSYGDSEKPSEKINIDALRGKSQSTKSNQSTKGVKIKKESNKVSSIVNRIGSLKPNNDNTPVSSYSSNRFRGIIAVTGERGSGVSTITANIAQIIAMQGDNVVILDMDLLKRFQSVIFPSFAQAEGVFTNTQLGVLTLLNNPDMVDEITVVVDDNLGLVGMSREPRFYIDRFADKNLDEVITPKKILGALGVLKGIFDVVIVDYPIDYIKMYLDSTVIIDKFIVCMENTLPSFENFFDIHLGKLFDEDEMLTRSLVDKCSIIFNRFNSSSKYGRNVVDENFLSNYIKKNLYGDIKVLGRIPYSTDFVKQLYSDKRAVQYNEELRRCIGAIVSNI